MEDLIELVAASFARHGIECPSRTILSRPDPIQSKRSAPLSQLLPPRSQSTITEKARKKSVRRDGACPVSLSPEAAPSRNARISGRIRTVLALDQLLFAII